MDNYLNEDMMKAIKTTDLEKDEEELIKKILFQEKAKKNQVWSESDAAEYMNKLLLDQEDKNGVD